MAAFRCIDTRLPRLARVVELGEGRVICLLRSDWVSHRSSGSIGWKIERVVCACVCVCVRACVRACVRVCVGLCRGYIVRPRPYVYAVGLHLP